MYFGLNTCFVIVSVYVSLNTFVAGAKESSMV